MLSEGANPYRDEPLRSCEHANRAWATRTSFVLAPLPPYALALLVPLARLPYPQAGVLWFALLVAAALVVIWAILELTSLPFLAVGAPIAVAVLLQSLPTGALAPIPLALLTAGAVMLARKRWTSTAVLLALSCIEPHVAIPAALAAFVLVPEMRTRLAIAALALVALSAIAGFGLSAEYFTSVLPAHARFELGSIVQFGLSSMLHNFGVPDRTALAIGSVQYALFVVLGIWLAKSLRSLTPAAIVLAPIALAVTGGVYIHLTQMAAALPLGFLAASKLRSALPWLGITLLSLPWNLLEAFTPKTVTVPQFADAVGKVIAHQATPGGLAYVANTLAYLGIGSIFLAIALRPRPDRLR